MKIKRIKGAAWRKVGDEMIVIHLERHKIFGLDHTAEQIWGALEEPQDLKALESIAANDVPVDTNVIDAVGHFVTDLIDEGLVDITGNMPEASYSGNVVEFKNPRIEWREELQQFAGKCNLVPGQSYQCDQIPSGS